MRIIQILLLLVILLFKSQAQTIDEQSQKLIDRAEKAMGGQEAYKDMRHLTWNFLGLRVLTWDKHSGDVRIDFIGENSVYLFNTQTKEGRIFKHGQEYTHSDSLQKYLQQAYEIWINDSYWLVMPFKLRDEGIKCMYLGEMTTQLGYETHALQLTFENTGVTPENKYLIYFEKKTGLICQWDFYRKKSDTTPLFSSPWLDYLKYGRVLLSGDRGERKLTPIKVFKKLPKTVYTEFKRPFYLK